MRRSASATVRNISTGVPFLQTRRCTQSSGSLSTHFTRLYTSSPTRDFCSSSVCLRWLPRPKTIVTSSSFTPAFPNSSKRRGMIIFDGTGRVISLVTITIFSPDLTISNNLGVPKGTERARATSSASDTAAGAVLGRIFPNTF